MKIELWLPATWKAKTDHFLVKLHSLGPVEDNTGKILTTKKRLEGIGILHGEVLTDSLQAFRAKKGPIVSLVLEVPAREAISIKAFKGKAEVSLAKEVALQFDDLLAIIDKPLKHPKLKNLKLGML